MMKGRRDSRDDVSASTFQPCRNRSNDRSRSAPRKATENFKSAIGAKPPLRDALSAVGNELAQFGVSISFDQFETLKQFLPLI
jgi:hypothetical protein